MVQGEPPPEVKSRVYWWSGDHRLEGILIWHGPGLEPGFRFAPVSLCDWLPTVLYGAGLGVPSGLDGSVAGQLFSPSFLAAHQVHLEDARPEAREGAAQLSSAEEEMIEEKLRSLGYL